MPHKFLGKFFVILFFGVVSLSISSCAPLPYYRNKTADRMTVYSEADGCKEFYQRTKNDVEYLGNKRLSKLDSFFWQGAKSVSIFLFDRKEVAVRAKGEVDGFNTAKNGALLPITLLDPRRKEDAVFVKKAKELITSSSPEINQYLLDQFKQEINLPEKKDMFINEGIRYFVALEPSIREAILTKSADRYIFINLQLRMLDQFNGDIPSMWKEPKVNLQAKLIIMAGKDKIISEFIQKNDYLPLYPGPEVIVRFDPRLKTELRRFKSYPGIYLGTIAKGSGFYSKKEWLSEDGSFLEQKVKSLIEDLAREAGKVFFQ